MNLAKIRAAFPVCQNIVYANHAGVAPLSLPVKEAVDAFLKDSLHYGYTASAKWHRLVDLARQNAATLLNSSADEVAFTSSTSQGLSTVAGGLDWKKGDNILIPDCEFPANIYPWLHLQSIGVEVKFIPSKQGRISLEELDQLADSRTRLLSISSVQYGSGWRAPLKELGEWCRSRNIYFCVDAIQSLGALPMDVKEFQIDFLAADGHKWLLGPEGTALFFCSKRVWDKLTPNAIGWKSVINPLDFDHIHFQLKPNAQKFEPGSDNVIGIHALNAAMELLLEHEIEHIEKRLHTLTDFLRQQIEAHWPKATLISPEAYQERSGIVAVDLKSDPNPVVEKLSQENIYVAARRGWLRLSPHFYNTEEEMDKIVHRTKNIL